MGDGLSPASTLDDAEWMPCRINRHGFATQPSDAETKHVRRDDGDPDADADADADADDHDVEVCLRRDGRVRPGRRSITRSEPEPEPAGCVVCRDDREIVAVKRPCRLWDPRGDCTCLGDDCGRERLVLR